MTSAAAVEVWGEAVGLAAPAEGGVRFFAASPRFARLDGRVYPSLGHARLAAIELDRDGRARAIAPPDAIAAAARSLDRRAEAERP